MPALSFSAVEILPSLLDRIKTQTIRPLCRLIHKHEGWNCVRGGKPRLKVGDTCKIYWKQRTSPKWSRFCRKCGMILWSETEEEFILYENGKPRDRFEQGTQMIPRMCPTCEYESGQGFPKLIGEVEITEVFEIEMGTSKGTRAGHYVKLLEWDHKASGEELAKRDSGGIWSELEMFKYFDSHYDLSTPKRFAVYRWKWLKERSPNP
jgi:hypothetical protein